MSNPRGSTSYCLKANVRGSTDIAAQEDRHDSLEQEIRAVLHAQDDREPKLDAEQAGIAEQAQSHFYPP